MAKEKASTRNSLNFDMALEQASRVSQKFRSCFIQMASVLYLQENLERDLALDLVQLAFLNLEKAHLDSEAIEENLKNEWDLIKSEAFEGLNQSIAEMLCDMAVLKQDMDDLK